MIFVSVYLAEVLKKQNRHLFELKFVLLIVP